MSKISRFFELGPFLILWLLLTAITAYPQVPKLSDVSGFKPGLIYKLANGMQYTVTVAFKRSQAFAIDKKIKKMKVEM